jgi:DNA-binding NarL/FixJ family response regulator
LTTLTNGSSSRNDRRFSDSPILRTGGCKVAQGRKYVSPSLAEKLAFDLDVAADKQPHEILSDREFQVMCLIASGKTLAKIARDLSLSLQTISTYRARVLEKMKMKTNADIIRYALENRLVE